MIWNSFVLVCCMSWAEVGPFQFRTCFKVLCMLFIFVVLRRRILHTSLRSSILEHLYESRVVRRRFCSEPA